MKPNQLKAVVAGTRWGQVHARGFDESPHAQLCALWSRGDTPEARQVAKRFGVKLFTDYTQMLEQVKPDLVGIAVPEAGHAPLTLEALDHGGHVYCEKVLSDSAESAQQMIDRADDKNLSLNVGYNYRYSPSFLYLTKAVRSGELGQMLFVHLRAFTWCVHHLTDYVCSLLGRPMKAVSRIDRDPRPGKPHKSGPELAFPTFLYAAYTKKAYMVVYEDGAVLLAGATDYSSIEEPGGTLLLEGIDGRAEVDDLTGTVKIWRGSREATIFTPSQICDHIGLKENGVAAVKDFARSVAEGQDAPIPGKDGLMMIRLEEAILRSAHTDQWEAVEQH